jgi:hypothetical protein
MSDKRQKNQLALAFREKLNVRWDGKGMGNRPGGR